MTLDPRHTMFLGPIIRQVAENELSVASAPAIIDKCVDMINAEHLRYLERSLKALYSNEHNEFSGDVFYTYVTLIQSIHYYNYDLTVLYHSTQHNVCCKDILQLLSTARSNLGLCPLKDLPKDDNGKYILHDLPHMVIWVDPDNIEYDSSDQIFYKCKQIPIPG